MKDKILYIDDEKENLESFQLAFWTKYDLLLAKDTKEAEGLLKESQVKLIITDQKMAGETGLQFIERIKDQYPNVLFIVLTAYAELDIVLDAINNGVYQFIQKPWEQQELQQVIANAIDRHDLQKQNKDLLTELKRKNDELRDSNEELLSLARQYRERKIKSQENENLLDAIFKNIPLMIFLVGSEGEIIKVNTAGLETANKDLSDVIGTDPGDVLSCVDALASSKGCGSTEACNNCLIRSTINNSLKYKTDYHKVEAKLHVKKGDVKKESTVLLSTSFIKGRHPMTLVIIDDKAKNHEIIALK
jgi:CheY-like chemotaxis protein